MGKLCLPLSCRYESLFEEVRRASKDNVVRRIYDFVVKHDIDVFNFKNGEGKALCRRLVKNGMLSLLNRLMKVKTWKLRSRLDTQRRFIKWCVEVEVEGLSSLSSRSLPPMPPPEVGAEKTTNRSLTLNHLIDLPLTRLEQVKELNELKVSLCLSNEQVGVLLYEIFKK